MEVVARPAFMKKSRLGTCIALPDVGMDIPRPDFTTLVEAVLAENPGLLARVCGAAAVVPAGSSSASSSDALGSAHAAGHAHDEGEDVSLFSAPPAPVPEHEYQIE